MPKLTTVARLIVAYTREVRKMRVNENKTRKTSPGTGTLVRDLLSVHTGSS